VHLKELFSGEGDEDDEEVEEDDEEAEMSNSPPGRGMQQ
jgi:hypothetical protein